MEDYDRIKALLKGSDMVFVAAGVGELWIATPPRALEANPAVAAAVVEVIEHLDAPRLAAFERDAALHQPVDDAVEQRLRQPRQRLDRQFLGAQLDQQ